MFSAIDLLGAVAGAEVKMIAVHQYRALDGLQIAPLIACYGRLNQ